MKTFVQSLSGIQREELEANYAAILSFNGTLSTNPHVLPYYRLGNKIFAEILNEVPGGPLDLAIVYHFREDLETLALNHINIDMLDLVTSLQNLIGYLAIAILLSHDPTKEATFTPAMALTLKSRFSGLRELLGMKSRNIQNSVTGIRPTYDEDTLILDGADNETIMFNLKDIQSLIPSLLIYVNGTSPYTHNLK